MYTKWPTYLFLVQLIILVFVDKDFSSGENKNLKKRIRKMPNVSRAVNNREIILVLIDKDFWSEFRKCKETNTIITRCTQNGRLGCPPLA